MRSVKYGINGGQCHCNGCGRKFGAVSGFDLHRKKFQCVDPSTAGLWLDDGGFWRLPKRAVLAPSSRLGREISPEAVQWYGQRGFRSIAAG